MCRKSPNPEFLTKKKNVYISDKLHFILKTIEFAIYGTSYLFTQNGSCPKDSNHMIMLTCCKKLYYDILNIKTTYFKNSKIDFCFASGSQNVFTSYLEPTQQMHFFFNIAYIDKVNFKYL